MYDYDTAELAALALVRAIHDGDQAATRAPHDERVSDLYHQAAQHGPDGVIALLAALARLGLTGMTYAAAARGERVQEVLDGYEQHLLVDRAAPTEEDQ